MRMKSGITLLVWMVVLTVFPLVGCSPRVVSDGDIEQMDTALQVNWSPEMDCTFCHTVEAASYTQDMTASFHSEQDCVVCHDDGALLSEAHAEITMNDNLPARLSIAAEISDELCESCHSLESRSQATMGSTILTDENGTIVNPHMLPDSHQDQKVSCTDCHVMHKINDIASSAQNTCVSCHHENVYQCGTCHE